VGRIDYSHCPGLTSRREGPDDKGEGVRGLVFCVLLAACGGASVPPKEAVARDDGSFCLPDEEICKTKSECCSGVCIQRVGWWYPHCVPDVVLQDSNLPIGFYEEQCQWDACEPPPSLDSRDFAK
jgi:hypothetical protein